MCFASLKDGPKALPEVIELAKIQTKADVKVVPAFAVLGEATNWPSDAAKAYMTNKLAWFLLYDDKAAVMARGESFGEWIGKFKPHCENEDPEKDLEIAYSGCVECLMPAGLASSANNFYMIGSFKCKDEEAVKTAMECIKQHGDETMEKEKDGFIGTLLIPPAAMDSDMAEITGCEKEDLDTLHVTYLMAFKTEAAWDNHQKQEYWGPFLMGLVDKCMTKDENGEPNMEDITIQLHFNKAATLTAGSDLPETKEEAPKEEPKAEAIGEVPKEVAKALKKVDKNSFKEMSKLKAPPDAVKNMVKVMWYIMKDGKEVSGTSASVKEWDVLLKFINNSSFANNFKNILNKPMLNFAKISEKVKPIMEGLDKEEVKKASMAAGMFLTTLEKLTEWICSKA